MRAACGVLLGVATSGLLLTSLPAYAQTAEDFAPDCATGVLSYPPGGPGAATISNSAPFAGDIVTATSPAGSFDAGSNVGLFFDSAAIPLPNVVAAADGAASSTFAVPSDATPGVHVIRFDGMRTSAASITAVCLSVQAALGGVVQEPVAGESPVAAQPIGGGEQLPSDGAEQPADPPSALPFTGSPELVAVGVVGIGLVAAGAGTVVLARRRRRPHDATT